MSEGEINNQDYIMSRVVPLSENFPVEDVDLIDLSSHSSQQDTTLNNQTMNQDLNFEGIPPYNTIDNSNDSNFNPDPSSSPTLQDNLTSKDEMNDPVKNPNEDEEEKMEYNSEKPVGFLWFGSKVAWQTLYLLEKNFKLYLRGWISTLIQLLAPFVIMLVLFLLALLISSTRDGGYVETQEMSFNEDSFLKCNRKGPGNCYALAYTTNGNSNASDVIQDLITQLSWDPAKDIISFPDDTSLQNYIISNMNSTQMAISFEDDLSGINVNFNAPNKEGTNEMVSYTSNYAFRYTIYYNETSPVQSVLADTKAHVVELKQHIDNSILFLQTGKRNIIKIREEGMPLRPAATDSQALIFGRTGPQFFSLVACIPLVLSMQILATEKESMLRFGMKMMGLSDIAYWASWLITFIIMAIGTTLTTIISGYIFQIHFFLRSNPVSQFFIFFLYTLSLIGTSILLSTFTNSSRSALILGFLVLAITFILNQFLASSEFVVMLFAPKCGTQDPGIMCVDAWVTWIKYILYFYPPFNFAKSFLDVQDYVKSVFDPSQEKFVAPSQTYTIASLFERLPRSLSAFYVGSLPPTFHALLLLIMNFVLYLCIGLYLDMILDNKTGVNHKPWFFLQPSFWGINLFKSKPVSENVYPKTQEELEELDEEVRNMYHTIRDPKEEFSLRILNLKKTYKTNFGLPLISNNVFAVNGIDIGVRGGQVLGILGHNGSGKTTTINSVVGLISPSDGDIVFLGKSVRSNVSFIRQNLGICPQHDILFPTLTAWEHLRLYGSIKGMSWRQIRKETKERLKQVDLYQVRNKQSKTYSGGMKRRLSVAISTIGSPDLLILDECTSGLDVDVRRKIWKLIYSMQSGNRIILMTTHSMEEAEALSNLIVIMQGGKVIASGNSLQLKQKYGAGYNLTLIGKSGKEDEILNMVAKELPEATLSNANAGNLVFNVMPEHIIKLGHFVKILEDTSQEDLNKLKKANQPKIQESHPTIDSHINNSDSINSDNFNNDKIELASKTLKYSGLLKDWGISFTTLERVFLKLTDAHAQMGLSEESDEFQHVLKRYNALLNHSTEQEADQSQIPLYQESIIPQFQENPNSITIDSVDLQKSHEKDTNSSSSSSSKSSKSR